jgi:hypothetical protein
MAATELEEVRALLKRILPDPNAFAQRLLLQLTSQLGQSADPNAGDFGSTAKAFYTAAAAYNASGDDGDDGAGDIVVTPERSTDAEPPGATNLLLAGALGACECWGLRADCDLCRGHGSAGWTEPIPELFDEFVGPALARLSDVAADNLGQHGTIRPQHHDTIGLGKENAHE